MTIAEVSKEYGLTSDTLRYYERIGLIPPVTRNPNGIRNYQEEDCRWVEFIKCMRGAGLPVEVLIEYVALFQQGDTTREARKQLLIEQRRILMEKMTEIGSTIRRLDEKIERYDELIVRKEQELEGKN